MGKKYKSWMNDNWRTFPKYWNIEITMEPLDMREIAERLQTNVSGTYSIVYLTSAKLLKLKRYLLKEHDMVTTIDKENFLILNVKRVEEIDNNKRYRPDNV